MESAMFAAEMGTSPETAPIFLGRTSASWIAMAAMAKAIGKATAQRQTRASREAGLAGGKRAAGEKEAASTKAEAKAAEHIPETKRRNMRRQRFRRKKAANEVHSAWASWATSGVAPRHGEDLNRI